MVDKKIDNSMMEIRMFPLIELVRLNGMNSIAVPIDHSNLDDLVGKLMQMCDLIGDTSQRKALKDTIKRISRDWLNEVYHENGYEDVYGPREYTDIVKAKQYQIEVPLNDRVMTSR